MTLDKYPNLSDFLEAFQPVIHTTDVFTSICNRLNTEALRASLVDQASILGMLDWVQNNPYHAVAETHDWLDSKGEGVEELAWHQNPEPRVFGYHHDR